MKTINMMGNDIVGGGFFLFVFFPCLDDDEMNDSSSLKINLITLLSYASRAIDMCHWKLVLHLGKFLYS